MIRTFVFDMGGVLLRFEPRTFMEREHLSPEDQELVMRQVYRTLEWARTDRGTLTETEALPIFYSRLPERLHETVRRLVLEWDRPILPMKGMAELVRELKASGYGIYLLSNASSRLHEYFPRIPGSECFDGKLVSADVKLLKPQPEIYRKLFATFGLKPEECFFVDDLPQNIEGAYEAGMAGFVFQGDAAELRQTLVAQGLLRP